MNTFHYRGKCRDNQANDNWGMPIWLMAVLILLLAACVSKPGKVDSTLKPTSTNASSAIQTVSSVPAAIAPSATAASAQSSTITEEVEIGPRSNQMIDCLEEKPSPNNLQIMNGMIIYSKEEKTKWYTLAGSPPLEESISFPDIQYEKIVFSPNGLWAISYDDLPEQVEPDHANFQLIGPEGQSQTIKMDMSKISKYLREFAAPTFSFQHWYFQWVNDQIVLVAASYSETPNYGFPTYQYAMYNVFQQTWWDGLTQEIPDRNPYSWLNVSPDLKRVLYRTTESDMALWDRDQQKVVWMQPGAADSDQTWFVSEWSPDSRSVTFRYFPDLIILSEEGKVIRTVEKIYLPETDKYFQKNVMYQWSPDSRRLAFFISTIDEGQQTWKSTLYLYNLETDHFLYKCTLTGEEYRISQITWSPDGIFVLANTGGFESSLFYLFDLRSSSVYPYRISNIANLLWLPNRDFIQLEPSSEEPSESLELSTIRPTPKPISPTNSTDYPNDYGALVLDLLSTNRGCELPCWWGMTPGESAWEDEKPFLASFVDEIGEGGSGVIEKAGEKVFHENYGVYFSIPGYSSNGVIEFGVDNGIITTIDVSTIGTDIRYHLGQLLHLVGLPDAVFIYVQAPTPDHILQYHLLLLYPEKGIRALYEGEGEYEKDGFIEICPGDVGPGLTLVPPGKMTQEELMGYGWDPSFSSAFRSLETTTYLNSTIFYQNFKAEKDFCFRTHWDNWN